jgi:hypothetical protein
MRPTGHDKKNRSDQMLVDLLGDFPSVQQLNGVKAIGMWSGSD